MKTLDKSPKISIIIVNYNNAKFLSKSILSALKQSYTFKEVIVVDDRSTDNSIEILKKFKKKVLLIKNKKKFTFGSYNQINCYYKGFLKSSGEYIFFLDSDDYFRKKKVEVVMREFNKKKELNIVFDQPIWKYKKKALKYKFKQKKFIISNWPKFTPQSCISVKKDYAEELFNNLNFNKFESLWFDFRVACYSFLKNNGIFVVPYYLTYYRQSNNSASKNYKTFSKNWWLRRNQAHKFMSFLESKFKLKKKITLGMLITKLVCFFYEL